MLCAHTHTHGHMSQCVCRSEDNWGVHSLLPPWMSAYGRQRAQPRSTQLVRRRTRVPPREPFSPTTLAERRVCSLASSWQVQMFPRPLREFILWLCLGLVKCWPEREEPLLRFFRSDGVYHMGWPTTETAGRDP